MQQSGLSASPVGILTSHYNYTLGFSPRRASVDLCAKHKNDLRLARLQLSKSPSYQHGAQAVIFRQTQDAATYPGPLIPSRGLTPCT